MKKLTFCVALFIAFGLFSEYLEAQLENYPPRKEKPGQSKILQSIPLHKFPQPPDHNIKAVDPTLAQALQAALDSGRAACHFTGVSAAMLIPGQGLWTGTSGYSVPSTNDTITSDMIFGIASNTKTFIATILLQLQEEGVLSLDDPLHRWLPTYLRNQYKYIDSTITIRQLLSHTSGIWNLTSGSALFDSIITNPTRFWEPESLLTTFMRHPNFSPGTSYEYCNTGYILAGMIIKAATGTSVSTQLHQRFLTPLGLNSTFLAVEDSLTGDRAHPWGSWDFRSNNTDFYSFPLVSMYSTILTAGAVFSTPSNMVRWASNLYGGNVLQDSSLRQMLTFTSQSGGTYGLGVFRYDT